ncbi:MAG: hypothetical protein ACE5JJ_05250, partial [Nitrospinota bacterium]
MLRPFIKAVGTGKKGARNLTGEEAARAMRAILQGEASPVQFAAFAIALRIKGETSEELAAFVDAIREHYGWPPVGSWEGLDVGVPYDGKSRGPSLTPGAAILASAGEPPRGCGRPHEARPRPGAGPGGLGDSLLSGSGSLLRGALCLLQRGGGGTRALRPQARAVGAGAAAFPEHGREAPEPPGGKAQPRRHVPPL